MGLKRKPFRCGWRTLWVLAVCMAEIGRVTVKTGNAPIEQKISAYPQSRNTHDEQRFSAIPPESGHRMSVYEYKPRLVRITPSPAWGEGWGRGRRRPRNFLMYDYENAAGNSAFVGGPFLTRQ